MKQYSQTSNRCLESTLQRAVKQLRKAKLKLKYSKLPRDRKAAEKRIQELDGKKLRLEQQLIFNKAVRS